MSQQNKALLVALFLALVSSKSARSSGPAMKQDEYSKICEVASVLQKMPGKAKFKASKLITRSSTENSAQLKLSVAVAAANNASSKFIYGLLLEEQTKKVSNGFGNLETQLKQLIHGTALTAAGAGAISDFFHLLGEAQHTGTGTAWCLGNSDGTSNGYNAGYTGSCKLNMADLEPADYTVPPAIVTTTGFPKLGGSSMKAGGGGAATCMLTAKAGAGANAADFIQRTSEITVLSGLLKLTGSNAGSKDIRLGQLNNIGQNYGTGQATDGAYLLQGIGSIETTDTADTTTTDQTIEKLVQATDIKAKLLQTLKNLITDQADTAEALANAYLKEYGLDQADKGKNLVARLNNLETTKIDGTSKTTVKLSELNKPAELAAAAAYAAIAAQLAEDDRQKQQRKQHQECSKKPHKPEEICTTIGDDQTKCNAEKQCSYDDSKEAGKKCTYNVSKAKENNVPVTQTQTVGTETSAEKCKGKPQGECKSPDCKWDGTECKDSSILLNKQFSLSMAVSIVSFF